MSGDMSKKIPNRAVPSVGALMHVSRILTGCDIEQNLKQTYMASSADEVPDRFVILLARLKQIEGQQ